MIGAICVAVIVLGLLAQAATVALLWWLIVKEIPR